MFYGWSVCSRKTFHSLYMANPEKLSFSEEHSNLIEYEVPAIWPYYTCLSQTLNSLLGVSIRNYNSTHDIVKGGWDFKDLEGNPTKKGAIALPSSCKQSLACCEVFITLLNVLSAPEIVFLIIYLFEGFFSFSPYFCQPSYSSWFQWTIWKSVDYFRMKCSALVLTPLLGALCLLTAFFP